MSDTDPDIVTLASRIVYENRWTRVREDQIRRRDGSTGLYGVVEKANFVVVAPVDDGWVHLVQQYRYPIGQRQWEFPQGGWEGRPDADPLEVAHGELAEETGLRAGVMIEAGWLYPMSGAVTNSYRIFLAAQLEPGEARPELEEQDLITRAFRLADVEAMILSGEIQDATTVASFGMLRLKGLI